MKKTLLSFLLLATSLTAANDSFCAKIGGNYSYLDLKPDGFSSFTGNLGGAQASLEYKPSNCVYEGVTFLWRQGSLDDSTGLTRDILDFDTQVRLGYTKTVKQNIFLTPFTGFGWRYLGQALSGADPLDLNYNEVYIPVGLLTKYTRKNFSIGLNGIWMPQVFPTVNFVPLDNARWVTTCTLGNFQIELPLAYQFVLKKRSFSVELRPFFQYWQDGHTLAETSTGIPLGLPKNTYYFGGFQFNLGASY